MSDDWASYLDPDETILWEGKPTGQLFLFRNIEFLLIPFSLVWGGFAVSIVLSNPQSIVLGIPLLFFIPGLYVMFGRFVHGAYIRRNTRYAVTNKRAFIAKSAFGRKLLEKPIVASMALSLTPGRNGKVTLGKESGFFSQSQSLGLWWGEPGDFSFIGLDDPDQVYQLIRQVQRGEH